MNAPTFGFAVGKGVFVLFCESQPLCFTGPVEKKDRVVPRYPHAPVPAAMSGLEAFSLCGIGKTEITEGAAGW